MAQVPFPTSPDSSAQQLVAITLADTDLTAPVRGFYVGGSGNLKVTDPQGNAVTLVGVQAGMYYPIMVKRFWSTGSTATNIVGLI
jgi:hypothetical protein